MSPLGILVSGEIAKVVSFKQQNIEKNNLLLHLADMGLREGKIVEVLNNNGRDPLLLKIDESRIAINRSLAMKIIVRRVK